MSTLVINKEDLRYNIEKIKEHAKKSGKDDNGNEVKIIAVIKANGYGLGLTEFARFAIENGINAFAVATLEEAIRLRTVGIKKEIMMLSSTAIEEDIKKLVENNIIVTIGSVEAAKAVEKIGKELNKKIKAQLKIDTGFGRYGFIYNNRDIIIETIKELKNVEIIGTFTHFSASFSDEKYTKIQFERFLDVIEVLKMNDIKPGILHVCNSSAFINHPEMHLNAVRVGSAFLGRLAIKNKLGLKRIGHLESKVAEIKELPKGFDIGYSRIYKTKKDIKVAIIPCGNMDGFKVKKENDMFRPVDKIRHIVQGIKALLKKQEITVNINGEKIKVLGKIGTYHLTCDITNKNIKVGDTVKLEINPMYVDSNIRREYR